MISHREVLHPALPLQRQVRRPSSTWHVCDECWADPLAEIAACVAGQAEIPAGAILKRCPRRLVFRWSRTHPPERRCVVKAFPLSALRHRLKHRRYGWAEAINLITAVERGLSAPRVLAYGVFRSVGLVSCAVVCMQELAEHDSMSHLLRATQGVSARRKLLDRALPLFQQLYRAGCNHADFSPGQILVARDPSRADYLIDLQYATFLDRPKPAVLAAVAGHFGRAALKWLAEPTIDEWFAALVDCLHLPADPAVWSIYRSNLFDKRPRKARMADA